MGSLARASRTSRNRLSKCEAAGPASGRHPRNGGPANTSPGLRCMARVRHGTRSGPRGCTMHPICPFRRENGTACPSSIPRALQPNMVLSMRLSLPLLASKSTVSARVVAVVCFRSRCLCLQSLCFIALALGLLHFWSGGCSTLLSG